MTALIHAVVAVTRTKRRRYLWCAWWSGPPCAEAGAWLRVRDGLPPFPQRAARALSIGPKPVNPHAVLGVPIGAPIEELRTQFRVKALLLHPDHGGDASAFIALKRAYDTLIARRRRRR